MTHEVCPTTAENIIGATDAALQKDVGVDVNFVAQFLDIPVDNARNALKMATQLGLTLEKKKDIYVPSHPYAEYLMTSNLPSKAAILRFVLEQYQPYKTFKHRLILSGIAQEAANQTRTIHNISSHREEILNSFISLGTYTNSLISEGAGLYRVAVDEPYSYLAIVEQVVQARESAELHIKQRLGVEASTWIDEEEVLNPLVTAYQKAANAEDDARAPIVYAGNAVESFLVQIAKQKGVDLKGASGINAKADILSNQKIVTKKHLNVLKYLGHIRNATDHGTDVDPDVNHTWDISKHTAIEYVHVTQSAIYAICAYLNGRFIV